MYITINLHKNGILYSTINKRMEEAVERYSRKKEGNAVKISDTDTGITIEVHESPPESNAVLQTRLEEKQHAIDDLRRQIKSAEADIKYLVSRSLLDRIQNKQNYPPLADTIFGGENENQD